MAVMLPENSPLVGNLEKCFSDSLSDRHLRISDTCWVQCARESKRKGLILCTWVSECRRGREPPRDVSQGNDMTRQDLCLGSTLAAVFRIQRLRHLWSLSSKENDGEWIQ